MPVRPLGVALICAAFACCLGCRGSVDILEARLREQESALAVAQEELERTQAELDMQRRASRLLEQQVAQLSRGRVVAEQVLMVARAESVRIDRRFTGIVADGTADGASTLNVVFAPIDSESSPIRLPGRIRLTVVPVSGHQFASGTSFEAGFEDSWGYWQSRLIGTGYQISIPLESSLTDGVLEVEFETTDGRVFRDQYQF